MERTRLQEGPPAGRFIALDGGTTNTRARLVVDGQVVATARRSVGVRDTALAGGVADSLKNGVRDAIAEVVGQVDGMEFDAVVAAGMLSAEVGLAMVPHVLAPAGLDELAAGSREVLLPEVFHRPILIIPGVKTPPKEGPEGWVEADLMRGEECETLGAWLAMRPPGPSVFVWPGSHTKLVEVSPEGTIRRSYTTLAGEILSALSAHTLIKASLPDRLPEDPDPEAAEMGARLVEREGLGRVAFLVRIAALSGSLDEVQRASFLLGAVVADDADRLARHPILGGGGDVFVGGRRPLRGLYRDRLRSRLACKVHSVDDDLEGKASAWGALAVARRYMPR